MKKIWALYQKYREIINYLIIGGLTTVVSFLSYALAAYGLDLHYLVSNVISWICAVAFAYITNRIFVFQSKNKNYLKEIFDFVSSRLATLFVDMALMWFLVDILDINDLITKLIIQVVVTILNYILSKLFVFKKKTTK